MVWNKVPSELRDCFNCSTGCQTLPTDQIGRNLSVDAIVRIFRIDVHVLNPSSRYVEYQQRDTVLQTSSILAY